MAVTDYVPPVSQLLTRGRPELGDRIWSAHLHLGIGPEHADELIRMVSDERLHESEIENEYYAPIHAWRTLAVLRVEQAIQPLLDILWRADEDDWTTDELPTVLARIGPAALEPLHDYLANRANGISPRIAACIAVGDIGKDYPEARDRCVAILMERLNAAAENPEELNGFLVDGLVELRALESLPVMERAFHAGLVDESVRGNWDWVQADLGLKDPAELRNRYWTAGTPAARTPATPTPAELAAAQRRHQAAARKRKQKRKQAVKSRKTNRKRK